MNSCFYDVECTENRCERNPEIIYKEIAIPRRNAYLLETAFLTGYPFTQLLVLLQVQQPLQLVLLPVDILQKELLL